MPQVSMLPPNLRKLDPLVGTWDATIRWSEATHKLVGGPPVVETRAKIGWLGFGGILHYQLGPAHWLVGADENSEEYTVLYIDGRPVSRVARMTYDRRVWRIWRNAPAFRQRFEAKLSRNGRKLEGHWDKNEGKEGWARDFDILFLRSE